MSKPIFGIPRERTFFQALRAAHAKLRFVIDREIAVV